MSETRRPKLEICIDRLDSALAARDGGADRLEACGALSAGGVTPSPGLVAACLELAPTLDVMVMIRPHGGGFTYGADDLAVMLRDIEVARRLGVRGVVFGALAADRTVEVETTRRLLDAARPLDVTFHRAFDLTPDPRAALDALVALGVPRVLTSGQARSAPAGAATLRSLVAHAAGAISIMPGAGVNAANVAELLAATGATEVHASASETLGAPAVPAWDFVGPDRKTLAQNVRALRTALAAPARATK